MLSTGLGVSSKDGDDEHSVLLLPQRMKIMNKVMELWAASLASTSHDSMLFPCLLDTGQITHFAISLEIKHEVPVLHVVASAPLRYSR